MSFLPQYRAGDPGRFDFRVPDNLGNYLYPDWDDPELRVEFWDAQGNMQFCAAVDSDPALTQRQDTEGAYVSVDGIELTSFALGNVEARIYCRVNGAEVQPYPTCLIAFEVIPAGAPGPLYTTAERVRAELPGDLPDALSDEVLIGFIADQSRRIDAYLQTCYAVPFSGIGEDPPTPAVIERICRRLAVAEGLRFLGRDEQPESPAAGADSAWAELSALLPQERRSPRLRLPGYRGPRAVYPGRLIRDDESVGERLDPGA